MATDYTIMRKRWNGIEIEIRWQSDYVVLDDGRSMAHLEIESVNPKRAPLPITATGYHSQFIHAAEVNGMGGAEACIDAYMTPLAAHRPHRAAAPCQLALF